MTQTEIIKPLGNITFGLSDFKLIELRKSYGPQLQFSFTWLLETPEGKQYAQSTPGFRYAKKSGGKFHIMPPVSRRTSTTTYYTSIFSTDLLEALEQELIKAGWQEKVGSNNDQDVLRDFAEGLAQEMKKEQE